MGPAELLDYDRTKLRGVILEEGGRTSHVAIVARALGIPAIGQIERPHRSHRYGHSDHRRWRAGRRLCPALAGIEQAYARQGQRSTRGGRPNMRSCATYARGDPRRHQIALSINAGLLVDLPHLRESGADGVGLYRTELHFMMAQRFPRLDHAAAPLSGDHRSGAAAARWCSAPSISAPTRRSPICASRARTIPRWAGGRSGWRSSGRRCCGCQRAPCSGRRGARTQGHVSDDRRDRRISRRAPVFERAEATTSSGARPPAAAQDRARRDDRGAGDALAARSLAPELDFISIGSNDLMQFLLPPTAATSGWRAL